MNDEVLIELVRPYEELYNMASKKYSDNIHKDKIWANIGRELNTTGLKCKTRWISLRDQLRKTLKKRTTKNTQRIKKWRYEDSMYFIIPFFKERELQYNVAAPEISDEEYINDGRDGSFIQHGHNVTENASVYVHRNEWQISPEFCQNVKPPLSPQMPAQRSSTLKETTKTDTSSILMKCLMDIDKHESMKTTSVSDAHPVDIFFNGLAATVKTFSPEYQHLAKSKLFATVSELEWAQLQNKKPTYETPPSTSSNTCCDTNIFPPEKSSETALGNATDCTLDTKIFT